ncbi:MFS transporter [Microbacterium sp. ASV81]|uniref:MFS transporter n=1 Tax=Microbacterium capsulatum TaxID=3041921 RepID=A0ABU0XEP7_9MICO|nr:MFS transporter [Microbacterium sp. ASV81]MDQ4213093.1 MFS transporter [Microbacterium sp. ASV81]
MSTSNISTPAGSLQRRYLKLAESIDRIPIGRTHRVVILLVAAGMFFDILESNGLGASGPSIIATFGITKPEFALISSATYVGLAIGAYLAGWIADRRGRKFSLVLNLLIYTIGGVACALAPSYSFLMGARFVVGLGLGGELAVGIALVSEIMPTRRRASAVASLNAFAGGLGNLVAPAYAWLILVGFGTVFGGVTESWRWLFGLLLIPAFLVVFIRRGMPESPRYLLARGDVNGANRSLASLARGSVPNDEIFLTDLNESVIQDVQAERSRLVEIFQLPLLRRTLTASGAYFMVVGAQMSLVTLMPTFLVARGSTLGQSLVYTLIMQTGSFAGALAAMYTQRWRRRRVLVVAAILGCIVGVGFGLSAGSDTAVLILGSLFQFFVLLATTTIWSWAPELFPTRVRGFGVSFVKGTGGVGIIAIPPLIAVVFGAGGLGAVFLVMAAMFACIAVFGALGVETKGATLEDVNEARSEIDAI